MQTAHLDQPLTILGRELRTANAEANATIPPFWEAFMAAGGLNLIPDRLDDDLYAVYTNFAHPGVDNDGIYSLVIGGRVASGTSSQGDLVAVTIPVSHRVIFPVEAGGFDLVGAAWQEIWARSDLNKTYIADYERYAPDSTIEISIGVASKA